MASVARATHQSTSVDGVRGTRENVVPGTRRRWWFLAMGCDRRTVRHLNVLRFGAPTQCRTRSGRAGVRSSLAAHRLRLPGPGVVRMAVQRTVWEVRLRRCGWGAATVATHPSGHRRCGGAYAYANRRKRMPILLFSFGLCLRAGPSHGVQLKRPLWIGFHGESAGVLGLTVACVSALSWSRTGPLLCPASGRR